MTEDLLFDAVAAAIKAMLSKNPGPSQCIWCQDSSEFLGPIFSINGVKQQHKWNCPLGGLVIEAAMANKKAYFQVVTK